MLSWEDGLNALVVEGIEAIVFRTVNDQPSLWELVLPEEVRRLPEELARVDALLDDTAFFAPFVPFFDLRMGRPCTPMKGKPSQARRAKEHRKAFRRTIKWRTGSEGRISYLKRGYGWDRTRIDGLAGTRIWTGHGVLAHNLVKISALAA